MLGLMLPMWSAPSAGRQPLHEAACPRSRHSSGGYQPCPIVPGFMPGPSSCRDHDHVVQKVGPTRSGLAQREHTPQGQGA